MTLSIREKIMRKNAINFAVHNNFIEGVIVDAKAIEIFKHWADGKISFLELEGKIDELCQRSLR